MNRRDELLVPSLWLEEGESVLPTKKVDEYAEFWDLVITVDHDNPRNTTTHKRVREEEE